MNLPGQYAWINKVEGLPLMIVESLKVYGVHEFSGALVDNPVILGWAKEIGVQDVYKHDETSWCGLLHGVIVKRAGKPILTPPADCLWALNWLKFGVSVPEPMLGDTMVKKRFDANGHLIGGHVTTYFAEDNLYYHCIGGNQSDMVNIARILKSSFVGFRRPEYRIQPLGVKKYFVDSTGSVLNKED